MNESKLIQDVFAPFTYHSYDTNDVPFVQLELSAFTPLAKALSRSQALAGPDACPLRAK